jgi:hypothetical protein
MLGSAVLFALGHLPGYGTAALPVDLGPGCYCPAYPRLRPREVPAATHAVASVLAVI